ncbi:MAG: hypothetical protein ABSC25_16280 [Roseiarcus sp.]|jgi:hypothetical protein
MIEAGAVGARFTILDDASPVLKRLMDLFNSLQLSIDRTQAAMKLLVMPPGLNRSLGAMEKRFMAISGASKAAGDVASASFAKMDSAMAATAANLGNVSREMKAIAAESRALNGPRSLRTGAGPSHGGGLNFAGAAVALPGGQRAHIGGTPALAAAGAIGYGAYEEANIEDFVNKIFLSGQITTGNEKSNPLFGKIRDSILKAYTMTGLPLAQIEEGILTGTRGLAGIDLEKRLALMPGLLAASATEASLKNGTTIPEAMQAFVGLAHMEGKYSPDEIAKLADHFAYLSTTTPVSVEQIERAASYAIPMLRTADFDPEQLLLMVTSMQRAGIQNTKSGTWISQLAMQSFPGTSLMSKMLFAKHEAALKSLGLIDAHDEPTWFTNGRPDLVKMTGIAGDAIAKMDPAHRLAVEKALWGQQGGRAAGFFADPTNRGIMASVADEEKGFIAGEPMWKQALENSPIVQFRTAFAGLNVELINLGSNVLPYVTGALKEANQTLGGKGELGVLGAGLLGWMFKGALWNGAKALGGRALGLGGPWGVLASLAAMAGPEVYNDMLRDDVEHPGRRMYIDPGVLERARRNAIDFRADPEGAHGRVMGSGAFARANAPAVNTQVNVKVLLDGRAIAAAVEKEITTTFRSITSSSAFDGQASETYPDHGFH